MPIETNPVPIRPVGRPQTSSTVDGVSRREDGSSSGFSPRTNVSIKNAVNDMTGILSKISTNQQEGVEKLPENIQKVIQNVMKQAFSMDETLAQGIGSTLESQRFSMEQLSVFSRMLSQMAVLSDKGFSMEISDQMQALLTNLKTYLTEQEGNVLEPIILNKLAFELLDTKAMEDLPPALQQLLSQLQTAGTMPLPQNNTEGSSFQFLKQLVQFFMPRPSAEEGAPLPQQNSPQQQGTQQSQQNAPQQQSTQQFQQNAPQQQGTQQFQQNAPQQQGTQQFQQNAPQQQGTQQFQQNAPQQQGTQQFQQNAPQQQGTQQFQQNTPQQQGTQQFQQNAPQQQGTQQFQQNAPQQQGTQQFQQNTPQQQGTQQFQQNAPQQQGTQQFQQNAPQQQGTQQFQQNAPQQQGTQQFQQNAPQQQGTQQFQQNAPQQQGTQQFQQNAPQQQGTQQFQQNAPQQQGTQQFQQNAPQQQFQQNAPQQQGTQQFQQNAPQQHGTQQSHQNSQQGQDFSGNQSNVPHRNPEPIMVRHGTPQHPQWQGRGAAPQGQEQSQSAALQQAREQLLQQPIQNTVRTMETMKGLAQLLLKNATMTPQDTAMLQNFVNGQERVMSENDARHLQNLLRLCQQNVPATVQQAAIQQNMPDLPRLWAFMQLCDMAFAKNMKGRELKKAGRDVADFVSSMRHSMGGENYSVRGQRSLNFMIPLFFGDDNDVSYPSYIHVYDENGRDPETNMERKETWLRLCVLTDNIGAVELTCRVYEENHLDMRLFFSNTETANQFREFVPELKDNLKASSLRLEDFKIGAVGERRFI